MDVVVTLDVDVATLVTSNVAVVVLVTSEVEVAVLVSTVLEVLVIVAVLVVALTRVITLVVKTVDVAEVTLVTRIVDVGLDPVPCGMLKTTIAIRATATSTIRSFFSTGLILGILGRPLAVAPATGC